MKQSSKLPVKLPSKLPVKLPSKLPVKLPSKLPVNQSIKSLVKQSSSNIIRSGVEEKLTSLKKNIPVINSISSNLHTIKDVINNSKPFNNKQPVVQINNAILPSSATTVSTTSNTTIQIPTKPNNKQSSLKINTSIPPKTNNKQPTVIANISASLSPSTTVVSAKLNNKQSSSISGTTIESTKSNITTLVPTTPNNKHSSFKKNTSVLIPTKPVEGIIPNNLPLNKYVKTILNVNNNFTKKTYTDLTPIIDNILDPSKKLTPKNSFIIKNIISTIFTKNIINSNGINILTKIIGKINNTSNIEHKTLLVMIKENIVLYGKETQYKNILSNIEPKLKS